MSRWSLVLFVLAAACAPAPPPPPPAPAAPDPAVVRRAIDEANARASAAMIKGEPAAVVAASYADDAVLMMPDAPKAVGKDAIIATFGALLEVMSVKAVVFRTDEVILDGDLAVETGGFDMTLQPKKGKEVTNRGKYITVWKKQADGSWKIIRDISNSDPPPTR